MHHRQIALNPLASNAFLVASLLHLLVGHAARPESPNGHSMSDLIGFGNSTSFGKELQALIDKVSNKIAFGLNMSYHSASKEDRIYKDLRDHLRHGLEGFAHGARHLESRIPKEQSKWIADIQTVITNATVHHAANNRNSLGALQSRSALPHMQTAGAVRRQLAGSPSLRDRLDEQKALKMHKVSSYATAFKNPIDGDGSKSWTSPVEIDAAEALEMAAVESRGLPA
mmetsp:Transcript_13511/g.26589  ORF Transcript_13511/g.26589 Transcript_13511/m.26589 type:complete len:227 (-) Transcript_13511:105-785(-)